MGFDGGSGLGDFDRGIGKAFDDLGLGGTPGKLDRGVDAALFQVAPRVAHQFGGNDLAFQILDLLD